MQDCTIVEQHTVVRLLSIVKPAEIQCSMLAQHGIKTARLNEKFMNR